MTAANARCSRRSGRRTSSARTRARPRALRRPAPRPRGHSPQAFAGLRARGLRVRRPDRTVATMDHSTPTLAARPRRWSTRRPRRSSRSSRPNCAEFGVTLYASTRPSRASCTSSGPSSGSRSRARRSSAATATPRRTAPSGRSPSGSARARSSTSSRRSACCSASRRRCEVRVDGALPRGRRRQGHHPGAHRQDRRRRRDRARHRVPRDGHRGARHGRADDRLQHVDRGRRARRDDRARRRRRSAWLKGRRFAPQGDGVGRGGRAVARAPHRRRRDVRRHGDARRERARADDHLRHQPRDGHRRHRPRPVAGVGRDARPSGAALAKALDYMGLARRRRPSPGSRSTSSSSARAPTRASATCARRRASFAGARSRAGVRVLVVPGSKAIKRQAEAEGLDAVFRERGRRVARGGLLDVHRDERRPAQPRRSTP